MKDHLVRAGMEHLAAYGVAEDRYRFLVGDMFDAIAHVVEVDVVLCFGIYYHITEHLELLHQLAACDPRHLIVDTKVSTIGGTAIELRSPLGGAEPEPGSQLEGYPTRGALDVLFGSFGWTPAYFDWRSSGLTDRAHMDDYREGRRVSAIVTCPEHDIPAEVRERAVAAVLENREDRDTQMITIALVADELGVPAPALRDWVRRTDRARWRERGFAP
ncbi:MAG: hypothetical protein U5R31_07710 [Acidimicrobiia bacterium]|nr:hypothetical protein [Acidimicrobiia bacterium]